MNRQAVLVVLFAVLMMALVATAVWWSWIQQESNSYLEASPTVSAVEEPILVVEARNIPRERTLEIYEAMEQMISEAQESGIRIHVSVQTRAPQIEGKVILLSPYRALHDVSPTFSWSPPRDVDRIRVQVVDLEGWQVWETETSGTSVEYGDEAHDLREGDTYFWKAISVPEGIAVSDESYFRILSEEEEQELIAHLDNVAALQEQGALATSPDLIRALILLHFDLYGEARPVLEEYVAEHPQDAVGEAYLRYVYRELGWYWRIVDETIR